MTVLAISGARTPANNAPSGEILVGLLLLAAATAAGAAALARPDRTALARTTARLNLSTPVPAPVRDPAATTLAARRLNRAAGTIATSVLIDSATEHYRGAFRNKAMYTPLATSALTLLASFHGHHDFAPKPHWLRDTIYALAGLTGLVGTGFHLYNVAKRPGGFCWQNVFYGAPLGAPAAMLLSGMTGFLAERVRDNPPGAPPDAPGTAGGAYGRRFDGGGLVGTAMEAGLLHFRGAFHNPGDAAAGARRRRPRLRCLEPRPWTRPQTPAPYALVAALTALLGVAGVGFHAIGVARNMGGWRNWTQNLQAGPPAGASLLHGARLAGLAALRLLQDNRDD